MAISVTGSPAESIRTATTDPYTFNYTPGANTRGIILLCAQQGSSTDHILSVTFNGRTLNRVLSTADTAGEPGRTYIYFVAEEFAASSLQFSIDLDTTTADDMQFVAVSLTTDTSYPYAIATNSIGTDTANPSVSMAVKGFDSMAFGIIFSGQNAPSSITPNANMTNLFTEDLGTQSSSADRQTNSSTSNFTFSYTIAIEDVALSVASFTESPQVFAQAQAHIKALNVTAVAQAQAKIVPTRVFAQALSSIDTGIATASDTFTRSVGSGLGTADVGGDWTALGTNWSVNGTQAVVVTNNNSKWGLLKSVRHSTVIESLVDFTVSNSGGSSGFTSIDIGGFASYPALTYISGGINVQNNNDALWIHTSLGTSLIGTTEYNTVYKLKTQISAPKFSNDIIIRCKVWKASDSEPGWLIESIGTFSGVINQGFPIIVISNDSTTDTTITLDNFSVSNIAWTQYAQAQARILQTYNRVAQAQASIINTYNDYAQAQAHIVVPNIEGFSQAQGMIAGTYFLPFTDTFTRTVSNGLGTSDNGDTWELKAGTSAASNANVLGTVATLASNNTTRGEWHLPHTLVNLNRGIEVIARFAYDKIPAAGTHNTYIGFKSRDTGLPDGAAVLRVDSSGSSIAGGTLFAGIVTGTAVSGYVVNDHYYVKIHIYKASSNGAILRHKIWKFGDSEPGWVESESTSTFTGLSHVQIAVNSSTDVNQPFTVTIDEIHMEEAGITRYAQAQAKIIAFDVEGVAQAQAQIIAFGVNSFAQAQAKIEASATITTYAQAQATILQTYNGFAQSQAYILGIEEGYAQAAAYIATGQHVLRDTFTRTESNGWGTPDIGPSWIITYGPSSDFSTNGSKGIITNSGSSSYVIQSRQLDLYNQEISIDFSINQLPDTYWTLWVLARTNVEYMQYASILAQVNSDESLTLSLSSWANSSSNGTSFSEYILSIVPNTTYRLKGKFIDSSIGTLNIFAKVWKLGDPEPEWESFNTGVSLFGGFIDLETENNSTLTIVGTFDNINAQESILGGFAQAQALIVRTEQGYGQSQANIKQTYNNFAQSQANIKATYKQFAQVQAQILQTYPLTVAVPISSIPLPSSGARSVRSANAVYATAIEGGTLTTDTSGSIGQSTTYSIRQALAGYDTSNYSVQSAILHVNLSGIQSGVIGQTFELRAYDWGADIEGTDFIPASQLASYPLIGTFIVPATTQYVDITIDPTYIVNGITKFIVVAENTRLGIAPSGLEVLTISDLIRNPGAANPSSLLLTLNGPIGQSQGLIKQTYSSFAQSQASIKATYNSFAQAQGSILQVYNSFAQSQAQIKQTYNEYAQAQALITKTYTDYGQAQGSILATTNGYGQAQAQILTTYNSFAQAQAQIIAFGVNGYAQALANIKGTDLEGVAQAQAKINAFDVNGYGQSQSTIKATYNGYAQANADILATSTQYGQAQASILNTYQGYANAQTDIKQTYQGYAQAQATILQSYQGYAQSQAQIKQTYQGYGQSQADILVTQYGFAQVQAWIETTTNGFGQAQGEIKQVYFGFAQAQSQILQTYLGFAQAQASILQVYIGCAQAQACIRGNAFGQAQGYIIVGSFGHGQAQAEIAAAVHNVFAQTQASIRATTNVWSQANAAILVTTNIFAQAQSNIKQTYRGFAQAEAYIKRTEQGSGQSQGAILATYRGYGQAQADILAVTNNFGQAQGQIKQIYQGYGQAQASIGVISAGYANAQTLIISTVSGFAQARGLIQTIYYVDANAQAWISITINSYAQAQAVVASKYGFGQASALILVAHTLKKLVASDRASLRISAQDRLFITIIPGDISIESIGSDSSIKIVGNDRAIRIEPNDRVF